MQWYTTANRNIKVFTMTERLWYQNGEPVRVTLPDGSTVMGKVVRGESGGPHGNVYLIHLLDGDRKVCGEMAVAERSLRKSPKHSAMSFDDNIKAANGKGLTQ